MTDFPVMRLGSRYRFQIGHRLDHRSLCARLLFDHSGREQLCHDWSENRGHDQKHQHRVEHLVVQQPYPRLIERVIADQRGGERGRNLRQRQRPHRQSRLTPVAKSATSDGRGDSFSKDQGNNHARNQPEPTTKLHRRENVQASRREAQDASAGPPVPDGPKNAPNGPPLRLVRFTPQSEHPIPLVSSLLAAIPLRIRPESSRKVYLEFRGKLGCNAFPN